MQNNIPRPNPFITEWLTGGECRDLVQLRLARALLFWKLMAARHMRTGAEMRSARTSVHIGGLRGDRWVGTLTVGPSDENGEDEDAGHALPDQFGAWRTGRHFQRPAQDLNRVLNLMAATSA